MFISGLSRMALKARIEGKVGYTGGRDTVWLAADFDVNFFWCSHHRVRSTVGTLWQVNDAGYRKALNARKSIE